MKIIVVSDSHGDTFILNKVFEENKDADLFIHCGDYCIPDYMMSTYRFVRGNCDWSSEAPEKIDIETPFGKIHVEHGDSYEMISNPDKYIKSLKCKIFLSGHTHVQVDKKIGDTYVFNPGSLTHPTRTNYGSFLIINIDDETQKLTYKFKKVDIKTGEIY